MLRTTSCQQQQLKDYCCKVNKNSITLYGLVNSSQFCLNIPPVAPAVVIIIIVVNLQKCRSTRMTITNKKARRQQKHSLHAKTAKSHLKKQNQTFSTYQRAYSEANSTVICAHKSSKPRKNSKSTSVAGFSCKQSFRKKYSNA